MQWWTRLMSIPTEELWRSMLSWQFLIAVSAVSFVTGVVCCLWLLRPRRRPRRGADRQSRRRESAARHLRQGALSAQSGGAQAPPAATGQTREQARRWRIQNISKQNAEMTYNSVGIELECAWSAASSWSAPGARPDAIARAPAENGKKGDKQECKEDIQRPRRRVETSSQGAPSAQAGGAQALSEAAGHTQAQARQRTKRMENLKKTHDNLLNILIELAHTAKLCTCTSCKAGKRAADVVSQGAHEVRSPSAASVFRESSDLVNHLASTSLSATLGFLQCVEGAAQGDEARDSSPVASSSASGPYRRSSPQVSSSAAGSAAFGAARCKGETTSLPWGSTAPARARFGASSYSTTPYKTQRMRISSGALFDTRIVHAQIKKYASPKECPEQQPAAASGFRTRTHASSFGDHRMQNAIGLLQPQVPLPAKERLSAETKQSRHQTPTVIKRNNFSSGGHRNRGSVSVEIADVAFICSCS